MLNKSKKITFTNNYGLNFFPPKPAIKEIPEVKEVKLNIVWDPPWTKDMMSDEAKLELGIYD